MAFLYNIMLFMLGTLYKCASVQACKFYLEYDTMAREWVL